MDYTADFSANSIKSFQTPQNRAFFTFHLPTTLPVFTPFIISRSISVTSTQISRLILHNVIQKLVH